MPKLVKDGQVTEGSYALIERGETALPENKNSLLPLELYLNTSPEQRKSFGVWLASEDDPRLLKDSIESLSVIACRFENFMDGRAFSQARTIRDTFGFKGEICATGPFIQDQLCYLARCGFNSFEFADEEFDFDSILQSLGDFSESYQAASDTSEPLFRRRA